MPSCVSTAFCVCCRRMFMPCFIPRFFSSTNLSGSPSGRGRFFGVSKIVFAKRRIPHESFDSLGYFQVTWTNRVWSRFGDAGRFCFGFGISKSLLNSSVCVKYQRQILESDWEELRQKGGLWAYISRTLDIMSIRVFRVL